MSRSWIFFICMTWEATLVCIIILTIRYRRDGALTILHLEEPKRKTLVRKKGINQTQGKFRFRQIYTQQMKQFHLKKKKTNSSLTVSSLCFVFVGFSLAWLAAVINKDSFELYVAVLFASNNANETECLCPVLFAKERARLGHF